MSSLAAIWWPLRVAFIGGLSVQQRADVEQLVSRRRSDNPGAWRACSMAHVITCLGAVTAAAALGASLGCARVARHTHADPKALEQAARQEGWLTWSPAQLDTSRVQ